MKKNTIFVSIAAYKSNCVNVLLNDLVSNTYSSLHIVIFEQEDRLVKEIDIREALNKRRDVYIDVIHSDSNIGFIQAHNKNIKFYKNEDFVLIVNDDIRIKEHGWDLKFINLIKEHPQIGLVGVDAPTFANKLLPSGEGVYKPDAADFVEGSFMFIPSYVVDDILYEDGYLFSPDFDFMYCEDADLSLRIKARGYKLGYVKARIQHLKISRDIPPETKQYIQYCALRNREILKNKIFKNLYAVKVKNAILIKRKGARGDVILLYPLLKALKKKDPACKIFVSTVCGDVLSDCPYIDGFKKTPHLEKVIDLNLTYELNPYENILDSYFKKAEINNIPATSICYSKEHITAITPFLQPNKLNIVIHAGPTTPEWRGRDWIPSYWEELCKKLHASYDCNIIQVGTNKVIHNVDRYAINLPVKALAALIDLATLFVGIDSYPFHVAQLTNTDIVVIFGSVLPSTRIIRENVFPITANVDCLGCYHRGDIPITKVECKYNAQKYQEPCMVNLQVSDVFNKIKEVLERRS